MARRGIFGAVNRVLNWSFAAILLLLALGGGLMLYDGTGHAVSVLMMGRWATGRPVDRQWTTLPNISTHVIDSVVMSEDGQFCIHEGVDWQQLHEVMDDPDGPSRGASTITMQVARNLFLWNGRSVIRKALEIPLALFIDAIWTKKRILEIYLNIAEWGDGIFGVEAAARRDFNKDAAHLTTREAALLATALPNPFLRNPAKPGRGHRELAAINMERAQDAEPWTECLR